MSEDDCIDGMLLRTYQRFFQWTRAPYNLGFFFSYKMYTGHPLGSYKCVV